MPTVAAAEITEAWLREANRKKSQYVIVCKSALQGEGNYPLYCRTPRECAQALMSLKGRNNPDTAVEVYDLSISCKDQMKEKICYHPPKDWEKLAEEDA